MGHADTDCVSYELSAMNDEPDYTLGMAKIKGAVKALLAIGGVPGAEASPKNQNTQCLPKTKTTPTSSRKEKVYEKNDYR